MLLLSTSQSAQETKINKREQKTKIELTLVTQLSRYPNPRKLSKSTGLTRKIIKMPGLIPLMATTSTAPQHAISHLIGQLVPSQDASTHRMHLKLSKVVTKPHKMILSAKKGISKLPSQLLETSILLALEFYRLLPHQYITQ